jgi:DNA-binding transcriptional ArsR family regulator
MKRRPASAPACCPPAATVLSAAPGHVAAFKALAHAGRLAVFFHLVRARQPLPANEVQAALGIPAPTLSHHLEHLEQAGLIERTRQERFVRSAVRREMINDLVRLLTACC